MKNESDDLKQVFETVSGRKAGKHYAYSKILLMAALVFCIIKIFLPDSADPVLSHCLTLVMAFLILASVILVSSVSRKQ